MVCKYIVPINPWLIAFTQSKLAFNRLLSSIFLCNNPRGPVVETARDLVTKHIFIIAGTDSGWEGRGLAHGVLDQYGIDMWFVEEGAEYR